MSSGRNVLCCVVVVVAVGCGGGGARSGDASTDEDAGSAGDGGGGGVDAGAAARVQCSADIPAAADGACVVSGGSGPGVLVRGTVLGVDTVYDDGSVLIDGAGTIRCVGCDCSAASGFAAARRVDCRGATISPGLINPHDHIGFTEGAPINHGATRYQHRHDWRGSLTTRANPHGQDGKAWGEVRMVLGGVTSMAGAGFANGMVRNLDVSGAAQQGLDHTPAKLATFPLGDGNETFRSDCSWRYKLSQEEAAALNAYVPHVAEGINDYAAEEFLCQSRPVGPGRDQIGGNTAVVHAIGLTAVDLHRMARDGAQLVWSPRSNIDLYGMTASVTVFDRLGGVIALGTDWTYSGSMHSGRELACADYLNRVYYDGHFTDRQLWQMVTRNAAIALGFDDVLGSLEDGKIGDVVVFATAAEGYRAVIEARTQDVALVLRAGVPLYGEAAVVSALGETCDALDVCGAARAICATRELGKSISALQAAVSGAYPAFFCGVPDGEPSCTPSRPGAYDGVTASDADGDGIADADDLCPRVFDPPRPIDVKAGGTTPREADADGDGIGDACDPTPVPADIDGDGVANEVDGCPYDADAAQADRDGDGIGDVCDPCPDRANRGSDCPAAVVSIEDIQTGTVGAGQAVSLAGVVVTAASDRYVAVQDPGAATPDYSGVTVFVPGTVPAVRVGSVVDVAGTTQEYYGDTQIKASSVTVVDAGTPLAAANVSLAEAASEAYEGVLVRVSGVRVTDAAFDCGGTPPCKDANLWELGGASGLVVYDRYFTGTWPSVAVGTSMAVTGVIAYRFDRWRIQPRTAADITIE